MHNNSTRIFLIAALALLLAGCGTKVNSVTSQSLPVLPQDGGPPPPRSTPTPTPAPALVSSQVFRNVSQTWEFQSQCSNLNSDGSRGPMVTAHTFVTVMPADATHTTWHYTKDQPCAYWMPDGISAEIYFFLEMDSTGAWYSTGGHIIAPFGFPWDSTHAPQDFTYTTTSDPGMPRPYLIIPAQSGPYLAVADFTTFPDSQGPNTPWETDTVTESVSTPIYSGWSMASIQTEGGVLINNSIQCGSTASTGCARETWLLGADGSGMQQITVYNNGGPPLNPPIVLVRIQ